MNTAMTISENRKPAFLYDRCAVERSQSSSDARMKRCSAFAERQGYAIREAFFDNGVSGNSPRRPSFDALLETLGSESSGELIMVVIDDPSRLARDLSVFIELKQAIQNAGGFLEVCKSSPDERFMTAACEAAHGYVAQKGG